MNRLCAAGLVSVLFLFCSNTGFAQHDDRQIVPIKPYEIAISYNQATSLIFPYGIKSAYWGQGDVIVQKAKGVENILELKAGRKDFEPTNLSVVTTDGRYYSFALQYATQAFPLTLRFDGDAAIRLAGQPTNAAQLEREASQVAGMPRFMHTGRSQQMLRLRLHGIFLSDNNLWLKLLLDNDSQVDFQPAYVRFFLRDKKRTKRTALHETELLPVYAPGAKITKGLTSSVWSMGFKPFTVPRHQRLIIQIGDETGGRIVQLRVKSRLFLKARRLPS